jgi:hypothetical protein
MRSPTKAALWLLASGLGLATLRIAAASSGLRGPGAEALSDLVGCVLAGGALFGVLAIRSLAGDADRGRVLDDGLAALALCAWLVAALPPRATNYVAVAASDDFVSAYAPASLVAVALLLLISALRPGRDARALVLRHAALLALVVPLTGVLVVTSARPGEAEGELLRALMAGAVAAVLAVAIAFVRAR